MAEELRYELIIDDRGAPTIRRLGEEVRRTDDSIKKMAQSLLVIKWEAITNLIQKAGRALRELVKYTDIGAKVTQTEQAFYAVANASGIMATSMLENLRAATRGTIEDTKLMQEAMVLLTESIPEDMIVRLARVSIPMAKRMGVDVSEAFDRITNSIENLMIRGLRQATGIANLEEVFRKYGLTIGKTAQELTDYEKRMAIINMVVEKGARLQREMGGEMTGSVRAIQEAKGAWRDALDIIGKAFLTFFTVVWSAAKGVAAALNIILAAAMKTFGFFAGLIPVDKIKEFGKELDKLSEEPFQKALGQFGEMIDLFKSISEIWKKPLEAPTPKMPSPPEDTLKMWQKMFEQRKALLERDIMGLTKWAETERATLETEMARNEYQWERGLILEEGYLTARANLETDFLERSIRNLEQQRSATEKAYKDLAKMALRAGQDEEKIGIEGATKLIEIDMKIKEERGKLAKAGYDIARRYVEYENKLRVEAARWRLQIIEEEVERQKALSDIYMSLGWRRPGAAGLEQLEGEKRLIQAKIEMAEATLKVTKEESRRIEIMREIEGLQTDIQRNEQERLKYIAEYGTAIEGFVSGIKRYRVELGTVYSQMEELAGNAAMRIEDSLTDALTNMFTATESFSDAMKNLWKNLANAIISEIMRVAVVRPLVSTLFGGIAGLLPAAGAIGLQEGGSFWVNRPTPLIVGEGHKREFVNVIPESKMGAGGMGGNTYYIDARGSQRGVSAEIMRAIRQSENRAVIRSVNTVADSKMRGGKFASIFER